jgi:hypothetical protein
MNIKQMNLHSETIISWVDEAEKLEALSAFPKQWPDIELGSVLSAGEDSICTMPEEQRKCFLGLVPFKYEKVIDQQATLVVAELQKQVNSLFPKEGYQLFKFTDSNRLWVGVSVANLDGQMDVTCAKVVDKLVDDLNGWLGFRSLGPLLQLHSLILRT